VAAIRCEATFALADTYAAHDEDPREMTREEAATFLLLVHAAET